MREEEFAAILERGHEIRGIEFKGPGLRSDKNMMAKVTLAVLGLSNLRDGGRVIIGVEETDDGPDPIGLDEDQIRSWNAYDEIATAINEYASPSVNFDLERLDFQGNQFVILRVY